MYIHIGLHRHVRPGKEAATIASMQRFAAAQRGQPGLQRVFTLKDEEAGVLMGLAIWDSEEAWQAARPAVLAALQTDAAADEDTEDEADEDESPDVYHLIEA